MALFSLAHGNTGAVPKRLGYLGLFVFVMTAWAKGTTKVVLMTSESLQDD
jgi:hypothetical protein